MGFPRIFAALALLFCASVAAAPTRAQTTAAPAAAPLFRDPQRRPPPPPPGAFPQLHIVTDDDYPPFHYARPDGTLAGVNIDLARAICATLKAACTIQARRWDKLFDALDAGEADAIVASMAISPANVARARFTAPYYLTPGRFVARKEASPAAAPTPEALAGKTVAAVAASAHEAFLRRYFPETKLILAPTPAAAREKLEKGEADLFFGDAIGAALWLAREGASCCAFFGGPFVNPRYFGPGVGVATAKKNAALAGALDWALAEISRQGLFDEIYLRYFPVGPF